jgi:hypothetical protein
MPLFITPLLIFHYFIIDLDIIIEIIDIDYYYSLIIIAIIDIDY